MQALIVNQGKYVFAKITSVGSAPAQFPFDINSAQDIAQANIRLYAIEAFTAAEVAKDQLGNNVVAALGGPSVMLTLVDKNGKLLLENYPVNQMRKSQNNGFPMYLKDFQIDLTKCYVTLVDTNNVLANNVVGFNLYYDLVK